MQCPAARELPSINAVRHRLVNAPPRWLHAMLLANLFATFKVVWPRAECAPSIHLVGALRHVTCTSTPA
jgi:hypothetical protein